MAMDDDANGDRDERTIFVGGLSEKNTEAILYELFFQAGPIERVSIPKEKDGKIKTFGFVTYKHLSSVGYALNIFAGTKLYGKELMLRNRNANRNRDQQQYNSPQASSSLKHGYNSSPFMGAPLAADLSPSAQQMLQQQLLMMATGHNLGIQSYVNAGAQMFTGTFDQFASTRADTAGSQREHFVERNRYQRDENRSNRNKPYRRSRSRSPKSSHHSRDRSPVDNRNRDRRRYDDKVSSNYSRWGKR